MSKLKWVDGRPTPYMEWNNIYYRNLGPNKISTNNSFYGSVHQALIWNATYRLQPRFKEDVGCTLLLGTPGPARMEFLTVDCGLKVKTSGILCMEGGIPPKQTPQVLYTLNHWFSLTLQELGFSHFKHLSAINLKRLPLKSFKRKIAGQIIPDISKVLTTTYLQHISRYRESLSRWAWHEDIYTICNDSIRIAYSVLQHTSVSEICAILAPFKQAKVIHLSSQVIVPTIQSNLKSRSVLKVIREMTATVHCLPGWIVVNGKCLTLGRLPQAGLPHDATDICEYMPEDNELEELYEHFLFARMMSLSYLTCHTVKHETGARYLCVNNSTHLRIVEHEKFTICITPPVKTECQPGYIDCKGTCILDSIDCIDISDSLTCFGASCNVSSIADVCYTPLPVTTSDYCYKHCHPDNCTCDSLYFQCMSGGCIHSAMLCDDKADCLHAEDEDICSRVDRAAPTSYYKHSRLDDLFPDEMNASDELSYIHLLKSRHEKINTCAIGSELPCVIGHSACYPVDKQCHYDLAEDGRLRYCTNGAHLEGCTITSQVECSGSFKCQYSYCIPTFRVCDGTLDCPYADDEEDCPITFCQNMLKCGDRCIHSLQICDGISQCTDHEDELMCGAPICPDNCQCLGFSVRCNNADLTKLSFSLPLEERRCWI